MDNALHVITLGASSSNSSSSIKGNESRLLSVIYSMLSPRRTGRFLSPSPLLSDLDLGKQEDLTAPQVVLELWVVKVI